METEYRYLLHLLGAYLGEKEPRTSEGVDWQKLTQLAQIHSVIGILGYMCKKYPICPDAEMKASLGMLCRNTAARFTQRVSYAQALTAELEKAEIDHILMKGFVLRDFYPVPELRTFNDIDIVIRPEDRQHCHDRMLALGYQVHTDWEPVFTYFQGKELYEVHTEIMEIDVTDKADYRGYFSQMWQYAQPVSAHSYRFTPEFHFLYLLTHIAKHVYSSGAGIRMYLDVAAFVRHYGDAVDWVWIQSRLGELKLDGFAGVVLTAVEEWFGVPAPMPHGKIPAEVMEQFLAFTMEAGVFGHFQRNDALNKLKHTDQEEAVPKLRQMLRQTFPSAQTIQARYTYLQDKPWLLPVAWIHRLVKNKEKLGQRVQQMQDILDTDTEEILNLQKLMRDIGL